MDLSGKFSSKSPNVHELEEPSQMYWNEATDDYVTTNQTTGPEITSSIAGEAKIFWSRPLKQESLKKKLDLAAIPSSCEFLVSKKVNPEIWSKMGTFNRSTDFKLQHAQSIHAAATKILRVASILTGLFKEKMPREIKEALTELKDSMTLAGNVSEQINQVRRDFIKPTLPREYKKLALEADETSELLFGSSLCEKLEKLKKENNLCALLSTKRKFEEPKNFHSSSKAQTRTYRQRCSIQEELTAKQVRKIEQVKSYLKFKVKQFKAGQLKNHMQA